MTDLLKLVDNNKTIIVANGAFPDSPLAMQCLRGADTIVCCDGAAEKLDVRGFIPDAIVGDLDSLSEEIALKYSGKLYPDPDQQTNDLTKAVSWCINKNITCITILGATGIREDHTIGNISLLAEYFTKVEAIMVTDYALFMATRGGRFASRKGQKISLFSPYGDSVVSSRGLEYPLNRLRLDSWWKGTLNVCLGNSFSLEVEGGPVIICMIL